MKGGKVLTMGIAPFAFDRRTTPSLMWGIAAALSPALAWGIYCFGTPAAIVVAASIGGALAGEAVVSALRRRFTLWDGSAFLTGLLIGMAMPPGIPPFIPAIAALFAVVVVKGTFGGLGSNWMNPALAGVAFALANWPAEMGSWALPRQIAEIAGVSGATPLALMRDQGGSLGLFSSTADSSVTEFLNRLLFSRIGAELPSGYIDLLIGNKAGAIGELSGILILAASVLLISRKVIRWEIPASIAASFALLTLAFGGLPLGSGFFAGDALFALLSGSFLLVAFFMATDPVTSPSSRLGMLIYGIGIGSFTFVFRCFGAHAEGTAFAVILVDCAVPAIDRLGERARLWKSAKAPRPMGRSGDGRREA